VKWRARPISLACNAVQKMGRYDCAAHVGFYLIDKGLPELEQLMKVRYIHRS